MTILTPADLVTLRTGHPHIVRPYLSILVPTQVYCGRVYAGSDFGDRVINVLDQSGSFASILAGMTAFVGSACGSRSKSIRRVRSTAVDGAFNRITFDENTVDWADGDYVTVYENWDFWGIFQYITPNKPYTFYKDRDIAYSDQNEEPSPVAIMGWHRAKFLDGPTVTFSLDGSDSYAIADGATISTYSWQCGSGVIANAAIATTTITFNAYGHYWVKLTVTDSNGKSQSTRRVFFVHARSGANAPYMDFDISRSPSGDWESGGWSLSLTVRGVADVATIPDDALIVLWAEQFFNGVPYYIAGDTALFVGYTDRDTIRKNLDLGEVSFDAYTIDKAMNNTVMRSVSLEYKGNPSKWYQYKKLTATRAVHHLLRWHTTLLDIADVILPNDDTELLKAVDDFADGSIYSMIDTFMREHGIFAHACCDKYGRFFVERDINFYDLADRAARPVHFTVDDTDRVGQDELEVMRNTSIRLAYCIVSGTHYSGSGKPTSIISQAPGELPHARGDSESTMERCIIPSQSYCNMIVGRVVAIANREFEEIRVPYAGNYIQALDVVPQEWIVMNVVDNKRDVDVQGRYIPRVVNTEISIQNGAASVSAVLEPECFGPDGIPGPYPPGISAPADPSPSTPSSPPWSSGVLKNVMGMVTFIHNTAYDEFDWVKCVPIMSKTFDNANPTWSPLTGFNNALETEVFNTAVTHDLGMFDLCPDGVAYAIINGSLYRMSDADPTSLWVKRKDKQWVVDQGYCAFDSFVRVAADPANSNRLVLVDHCDRVYYSADAGATITPGYTGFDQALWTLMNIMYTGNGYVLAVVRNTAPSPDEWYVYRSVDNGVTFSLLNTTAFDAMTAVDNCQARSMYDSNLISLYTRAATRTLYFTTDGGVNVYTRSHPVGYTPGRGVYAWGYSALHSMHASGSFGAVKLFYTTSGGVSFADVTPGGGVITDCDYLSYTGAYDNGWLAYDAANQRLYHIKPDGMSAIIKSYNVNALLEGVVAPINQYMNYLSGMFLPK